MSVNIVELRRLLAEATPGPWEYSDADGDPAVVARDVCHDGEYHSDCWLSLPHDDVDARLIAAAVNALPALLDRLEAAEANYDSANLYGELLRERVQELERVLREVRSQVVGLPRGAIADRIHTLAHAALAQPSDESGGGKEGGDGE